MSNCKTYTIQEIRQTLGTVISTIFTDLYNLKYHTYMVGLGDDLQALLPSMTENSTEINVVIGKLFYSSLSSKKEVDNVIEKTSPVILACIYFRYYILTKYFCSIDQTSMLSLPADVDDFFLELMVNYWQEACLHIYP